MPARLIDNTVSYLRTTAGLHELANPVRVAAMMAVLREAKAIEATQPAEYFFSFPHKSWDLANPLHFGVMFAPFDVFWIEAFVPQVWGGHALPRNGDAVRRFGAIVSNDGPPGRERHRLLLRMTLEFSGGGGRPIVANAGSVRIDLDDEGCPLLETFQICMPDRLADEEADRLGDLLTLLSVSLLFSLATMNAVNVPLEEMNATDDENRRRAKGGQLPLKRYSIIQLNRTKSPHRATRNDGPASGSDPRGKHDVRGHFSHYGMLGRGLLFGVREGKFWIPAHSRGNAEFGEIVQSYELHTPAEAPNPTMQLA